jgi:hypothetical protein
MNTGAGPALDLDDYSTPGPTCKDCTTISR